MEIKIKNKNNTFSDYKKCSIKDEEIDEDNTEITSSKLASFFILIAIMIILLIIIMLIILYKLVIEKDLEKSKKRKHTEVFLSYKEKMKVEQYINDCINGVLYDKNKYDTQENPKISVIIPIYNKEKFILRILRSIQNQSFKDVEIIFCDDSSNDNSTKLIENYQKEDGRIILIKHDKNKGTLINRNDGAYIAKGEYLFFIDGDDILVNDILNKIYSVAKKNELDIVQYQTYSGDFFNSFYLSDKKRNEEIINQPELSSLMYYENGYLHQSEFNVWGKLIKKETYLETLKNIDEYFLNQNMILHEDGLILFMLFKTAKNYLFIKDYGLFYYSNEYSTMRNLRNKEKINKSTRDSFLYLEYMFKYTNESLYEKNMAVCQFKFLIDGYNDVFLKTTSGFNYIYEIIDLYLNCKIISEEDKKIFRKVKNQFKQSEQNLEHLKY